MQRSHQLPGHQSKADRCHSRHYFKNEAGMFVQLQDGPSALHKMRCADLRGKHLTCVDGSRTWSCTLNFHLRHILACSSGDNADIREKVENGLPGLNEYAKKAVLKIVDHPGPFHPISGWTYLSRLYGPSVLPSFLPPSLSCCPLYNTVLVPVLLLGYLSAREHYPSSPLGFTSGGAGCCVDE